MANTYGYKPQKLGYGYQQPQQKVSPMAAAASRNAGPFFTDTTNSAQVAAKNPFAQATPGKTVLPQASSQGATTPPPSGAPTAAPQAPGAPSFDINTDPGLQQASSYIGMNEQQAQALALKQKQQELLAYGDPTLAASLFGQSDPFVQAAGQNPNSTLKQLGQQHDRGLTDMTESFNKQNLAYSGARVKGEQQFGQDYENALAQAASGVNQSLSGIDSQLAQALAAGNQGRVTALQDAYGRHQNDPGVPAGGASGAGGSLGGGGPVLPPAADPNQASSGFGFGGGQSSGPTAEAILAALLGGPGANQSRLNRYAG